MNNRSKKICESNKLFFSSLHFIKFIFFSGIILTVFFLLTSCTKPLPARQEYVLGTFCTVNLYEDGAAVLYDEIFLRLQQLEQILSANRNDTNIAAINSGAGKKPVKAAPETLTILEYALSTAERTGGAFTPAIGPLVKLWNIGTDTAAVPDPTDLQKAVALCNWRDVSINTETGMVYLAKQGMRLDLGGIAKGYAADDIARILKEHNVKRAIIDLGGNVHAYGEKERGRPWTVGIRDPETNRGSPILSLSVTDQSVVTSGIYERFFVENGVHYHHILDPATGRPSDNGLVSVTIISSSSMTADALSTSAFLLGVEKGLALINDYPETEAVFITKDKKVFLSVGLSGNLQILNSEYTLAQ